MTISGHVENGQIVLDEPVPLTEGMKVRVELLATEAEQPPSEEQVPTHYERYKPVIGIVKDLPPDFARNHDHYIHGLPKK
jgi:hypothetical protein